MKFYILTSTLYSPVILNRQFSKITLTHWVIGQGLFSHSFLLGKEYLLLNKRDRGLNKTGGGLNKREIYISTSIDINFC